MGRNEQQAVAGGVMLLIGIVLIVVWPGEFAQFLKGALPFSLVVGGMVLISRGLQIPWRQILTNLVPKSRPGVAALPQGNHCPQCGQPNLADALFCGQCGASLAPPPRRFDNTPPPLRYQEEDEKPDRPTTVRGQEEPDRPTRIRPLGDDETEG